MGAGHGHIGDDVGPVGLARWPARAVLVVLVLFGLAAVAAMAVWWPNGAQVRHERGAVPVIAGGVAEVHATLLTVRTACSGAARPPSGCGESSARVLDGSAAGRTVAVSLAPDVIGTGLSRGDRVLLLQSPGADFAFYRADRGTPMLWLAVLFAILVVLVARLRGLMALVGLAFAGAVVVLYLLPALLTGRPPVPVTVAACTVVLVVLLYATHGLSMRTSVALLGALVGLALAAGFAWIGVISTRLGGLGDDSAELLTFNAHAVDVQQLVIASVILAGLGTLNDVTVTQASALWELRAAAPDASRRELFQSAMRIGRDHVASTVYTLVFAYLGTALVLLVAVQLYRGAPLDLVTAEQVAEDLVRALVGGIALVLAMPVTTAIAAIVAAPADALPAR